MIPTVKATVSVDGEELDCVEDEVGLRTFEVVDGEFLLNGEAYEVRGVGLHQDGDSYTYATSDEDKLNDLEMIQEMGANALRTAHYPHDDLVYQWADENGFLVWNEIPNFGAMIKGEEFFNGVKYNTVEMVKQGYNHPSIIIWGIENELNSYADTVPGSPSAEELGEMFNELGELCLSLDPTRMIGEAQIDQTPKAHETAGWTGPDSTFDVVGFNIYTGWYSNVRGATPENKINRIVTSMQNKIEKYIDIFDASAGEGKLSYLMTEYGAGSNIEQHDDLGADFNWGGTDTSGTKGYYALGAYQPEEYANYVHEATLMALYGDETNNIAPAKGLWGSFIWAMFDFASYRTEGGMVGVNTKGMVTMDRQTKKDVFYLYKANWNKDDLFTYITSRRFEARATDVIDAKVYSNCDSVELFVDGVSQGKGKLEQDCVFVWSGIQLKKNETVEVKAVGYKDGQAVYTDTIDTWYWSVAAEITSDSDLNKVYDGEPVAEPEYTVTVEGEDITDEAEVTIEWYQVVEGADDDSENPGYEGGTPDYDTGYGPGYDDGSNPGYDTGYNPGYDTGYNPGYDTGYNPGYGNNIGYGDLKLDGPPTEVGEYYCLIIVSGTESYLGNTLRIDFEISPAYTDCDGTDCPSMQFTDLAEKFAVEGYNLWWHPYTDYVIEKGLMIGMNDGTFDLTFTTNRAMVTMVLWRLAGAPETAYAAGTYSDVSAEQWFAECVAWATKAGIVEGYGDGTFGPADAMKREDIVNMFYRFFNYLNDNDLPYLPYYPTSSGIGSGSGSGDAGYEQGGVLDGFKDADQVSDYALDAMIWAVENGLVIGDDNGCLNPQGTVERAELATFLTRWCEDIAK